jgi:hypothetical protein
MNALYHIEDFHMIKLLDEVVILSKKKNITHQENIHVLRILATFQYKGLNEVLHYHDLSEYEYRSIFMRLNHDLFDQFVLSFHKSTPPLKYAILDVISLKKAIEYRFFTENIFITYKGNLITYSSKKMYFYIHGMSGNSLYFMKD